MLPNYRKPVLAIKDFRFKVHLGCTSKEQEVPQEVSLSIKIGFEESPPGEKTDSLNDTICYAQICSRINEYVLGKKFNLVEKLSFDCLTLLKDSYPNLLVSLELNKLHPPVEQLYGGVVYSCGDRF